MVQSRCRLLLVALNAYDYVAHPEKMKPIRMRRLTPIVVIMRQVFNRNLNYVCSLNDELLEKAKTELNENPARRANGIKTLRQWLVNQRHIKGRTDDAFLLKFLRLNKFNITETKEKIDRFYTLKTAFPEWYTKLDIKDPMLRGILRTGICVPMGYDKDGRRIIIGRFSKYDPTIHKIESIARVINMISEYVSMDEQTQICGTVCIIDMQGITPAHLTAITPTLVMNVATIYQDALPVRMKEAHYINTTTLFYVLYAMAKIFLKSDVLGKLYFHGSNLKTFQASVHPEILPAEFGGTAGNLNKFIGKLEMEILKLRDYFIEQDQYNVDEYKRQGRPNTQTDL